MGKRISSRLPVALQPRKFAGLFGAVWTLDCSLAGLGGGWGFGRGALVWWGEGDGGKGLEKLRTGPRGRAVFWLRGARSMPAGSSAWPSLYPLCFLPRRCFRLQYMKAPTPTTTSTNARANPVINPAFAASGHDAHPVNGGSRKTFSPASCPLGRVVPAGGAACTMVAVSMTRPEGSTTTFSTWVMVRIGRGVG